MKNAYSALAAYYDRLGEHIDYEKYAKTAIMLNEKYGEGKSGLTLDLACGTGSVATCLAKAGCEVIAVDSSSEMLFEAREKASEEGLDILYLCQDMRELDLYGTIDLVVSAVDSMNYLTTTKDLEKTFSLVHNFLEPGGIFFFDMNTKKKFEEVYGNNSYVFEDDGVFCVWQNDYNEKTGICRFYVTVFEENEDGEYSRDDECHKERCYSFATVKKLLEKCGFDIIGVYSDLDLTPSSGNEMRSFFVAKAIKD